MDKRIKYFTYYGDFDKEYPRSNSPAADSKTDYVIKALNRCGYSVEVISRASISKPGFYYKGKIKYKGLNSFRYFGCFGISHYKILKYFNWIYGFWFFFIWCLFHIKRGEQIIVYHSLGYDLLFIWLNKIKRTRIIGEIEEIYQDVHRQSTRRSKNEYRFINCCSKYIFPTTYLDKKINITKKPAVVVHGIYSIEPQREVEQFDDGVIHVVYAGTLDPQKGGAVAAVVAAKYLSERYHIHILGFGDNKQISDISKIINSVNETSLATVTYEGYKQGEEFICFLQKCQIGLSTQDPTAVFNESSFPSKILTYLSNGLKVVSIRIAVVENSAVGQSLFYYDKQEPELIAEAINKCSDVDSAVYSNDLLIKLDESFIKEVSDLIND